VQLELWQVPVLVAGGFCCGVINALAGGGSFLTLPLLMLFGLTPQAANATNRVAIVPQCLAGVLTYHRHGVRPWRHAGLLALPTGLGALVGAYLAAHLAEGDFRQIAAMLFVLMIATIFVDPKRWERRPEPAPFKARFYPVFFLIGVYGGFLQAGVGTMLIAMLVLVGGYDVVNGSALKFTLILIFTSLSLALFVHEGQVDWLPGLCLTAGTVAGGIAGARLVIARGARLVRILVLASAVAAVLQLLLGK
jgi:uncharacterized membrane protein YfcA